MAYIRGLITGDLYRGFYIRAYISVNRFFKATVDKVPLKRLYVPELEKKTAVISIRRITLLKGRSSGTILRLREATSSPKWYHSWAKLVSESFRGPQKSHGRLYEGV